MQQLRLFVAAFDERHRLFEVLGVVERDLEIAGAEMSDVGNVARETWLKRHACRIDFDERQYLSSAWSELYACKVLNALESDIES
jgi:hypothetical protein